MALSIKNDEADRLARELSELTGESITEAIVVALRERLANQRRRPGLEARLQRLVAELEVYPVLDEGPPDKLIGYDQRGLPD
ncbi:MAG: type II toxin-antitoxin system VapB family antitoxin [Acidimicrobiia bacterium]